APASSWVAEIRPSDLFSSSGAGPFAAAGATRVSVGCAAVEAVLDASRTAEPLVAGVSCRRTGASCTGVSRRIGFGGITGVVACWPGAELRSVSVAEREAASSSVISGRVCECCCGVVLSSWSAAFCCVSDSPCFDVNDPPKTSALTQYRPPRFGQPDPPAPSLGERWWPPYLALSLTRCIIAQFDP